MHVRDGGVRAPAVNAESWPMDLGLGSLGKVQEAACLASGSPAAPAPWGTSRAATHVIEGGVAGGPTDIEAAPQVTAGPLTVAEGTLLPVRLPGE